jgi:hypothetical protein
VTTAPTGLQTRAIATAIAAAGLLALTACSGSPDSSATAPASSTASSANSSATPTATRSGPVPPTPLAYTPEDPDKIGSWVEVSAPENLSVDQRAALTTWTSYWQINMQAFNTFGLNVSTAASVKALDAVATGKARALTIEGVTNRRQHHGFTVGVVRYEVNEVRVNGNSATIRGCVDDRSYEVDQQGKTVVSAPGRSPLGDSLVRQGTRWLVSDSPTLSGKC